MFEKFFIGQFNDLLIGLFASFMLFLLDKSRIYENKQAFVFILLTTITPLLIFSQVIYNKYLNLRATHTILYYSSIMTILCVSGLFLNSIKFNIYNASIMYNNYIKYLLFFVITYLVLHYFFIGTIKIGVIHSVTGATNAIPLVEMLKLQILKVNENGGINGRKISAEFVDGKSDPEVYKKEAQRFMDNGIKVIFGGWTSADRKAMKPIVENNDGLLFYPLQYEGQECSRNIIYTGATPNQQLEVGARWALHNLGNTFYFVGTDSVYARTAAVIMKAVINKSGGRMAGEELFPYGSTDYKDVVNRILTNKNCIILNTINGTVANTAFFKTLYEGYMEKNKNQKVYIPVSEVYPIISFSITEHTYSMMDPKYTIGHYAVWNYFQSIKSDINRDFVNEYKRFYGVGPLKVINDPMESSFIGFSLWARAIKELDNSDDLIAIKEHMTENPYEAPEGEVILNYNNHLSKYVRVGMGNKNGLFDIVYNTIGPVDPRVWNAYLPGTAGLKCDHGRQLYGSNFRRGPLSLESNRGKQIGTTVANNIEEKMLFNK
jgi:urea transport system substrate-binding protein